jgi:hypothetical protein
MTVFDYDTAADLFGYSNPTANSRRVRRQPLNYRRFGRAADAIRFAIEEMPARMLAGACLEVDEIRFDGAGIRELYDSAAYPLTRLAMAGNP